MILVAGICAAMLSQPFTPAPSLAPVRVILTVLAVAASGSFLYALPQEWWVVDDFLRDQVVTTDGTDAFVRAMVVGGQATVVATVLGVWGRRNWAPLILTVTWLMVGFAWAFEASGESVDFEAEGEPLLGLELATWSLLLTTVTAVLASFARLAERRAGREPDGVSSGVTEGT